MRALRAAHRTHRQRDHRSRPGNDDTMPVPGQRSWRRFAPPTGSIVPSRGSQRARTDHTSSRSSRGPVSQGDRPRPELMAIHQLDLDALAQTGEHRRPVSGKDRLHKELVLVDQSQICQRQGERHATHEQAAAWLLLEPLKRLPQVLTHQLGIPIDPAQRARHDVLLRPVDGLGERDLLLIHPVRPRARDRLPPRRLHHLVGHPAALGA